MSYFQAEPPLDFDEANAFLAALADTVPLLEKPSDWNKDIDLDQLDTPLFEPLYEPLFAPLSPEVISLNGSIDEMFSGTSQGSDYPNPLAPLYNTDDDPFVLSGDGAEHSYTTLLGLTMSPYLDYLPNSGPSSLHLPVMKQEADVNGNVAPCDPMFNFATFGNMPELPVEEKPQNIPLTAGTEGAGAGVFVKGEPHEEDVAPMGPESHVSIRPRPKTQKAKVSKPERKPKTSHNIIEKKYRTSINAKILELREVVPTLKFATGKARVLMADLDGLSPACKLNKASILTKANEYIKHMRKKNKTLEKQIRDLQEFVSRASAGQPIMDSSPVTSQPPMSTYTSYFEPVNTQTLFQRRVPQAQPIDEAIMNNYAPVSNMNPRTVASQHAQPQPYPNANMFFGGLATMMGSSYINDNNFQAMSALPVFPATLFGNPTTASLLLYTLRVFVAGLGLFMVVSSLVGNSLPKSRKSKSNNALENISRLFSFMSTHSREPLSEDEKCKITALLLGSNSAPITSWIRAYICLRTKSAGFETLLLQFLVGTVIIRRGSYLSQLVKLDLKLRKNALLDAEYTGSHQSLSKLARLIKNVDGLLMFDSESFSQRFYNLSHDLPLCRNVNNGENALLFVDSRLKNENNLYAIVFEWRVLEILHELTLVYLDLLVSSSGARDDGLEDLKQDSLKLSGLTAGSAFLSRQFSYFELLLNSAAAPEVLKNDKKYILNALQNIALCFEEPELTDDEEISDDDSEDCLSETETSGQLSIHQKRDELKLVKHQQSMVCSLNLMNEEKFIVLLSSLVSFYSNGEENEKLLLLLNHLKFNEGKISMSLLTFTCLLKLLSSIVDSETEDGNSLIETSAKLSSGIAALLSLRNFLVLESLVKIMRTWLNDDKKPMFLTNRLRSDLSNLIISKSIALSKL